MSNIDNVTEHMEVRDASGVHVGTVDGLEGGRIKLTRTDSVDGQHHYIDAADVERVDTHVHLRTVGLPGGMDGVTGRGPAIGSAGLSAGSVGAGGLGVGAAGMGASAAAAAASTKSYGSTAQEPRRSGLHDGVVAPVRGPNWLAWAAAIAGLIALLFLLSRCASDDRVDRPMADVTATAPAATPAVIGATPTAGVSGLGSYLAGTDVSPRTFTFETLNFASGSAEVRAADAAEISAIAATLKQYPAARIELVGFADARGDAAANADLGERRAEAIEDALEAQGIDDDRIATRSGGESAPVAANASAAGRAENRRTELVVTAR